MNYSKRQIQEMRKEYRSKGYSFRSEKILMNDRLKTELINKASGVSFMKLLNEFEDQIIRIEHSQLKRIQYKFHKSVTNYASRQDKARQTKEIYECLNTLKERYKNNPIVEDIEHYGRYISLSCISETDPDLRIIFRVHHKNIKPEFSYDLSMRHYREFFEYTEPLKDTQWYD